MKSFRRPGWKQESHRHYLAAKGIKTVPRRYNASLLTNVSAFQLFSKPPEEFDREMQHQRSEDALNAYALPPEEFHNTIYAAKKDKNDVKVTKQIKVVEKDVDKLKKLQEKDEEEEEEC